MSLFILGTELALSEFRAISLQTYYFKQNVSEIRPDAVTFGRTESRHRYDIWYNSLVNIEVLLDGKQNEMSWTEGH